MDYAAVRQIISAHGLDSEPAFQNLFIAVQPVQCEDGVCPLGLYYPDLRLVVVPPTQSVDIGESVLLHELGHRHGHFYYNNLTEGYAESYRMKHQNGVATMYSGNNVVMLQKLGSVFNDGEKGVIELRFGQPLTSEHLRIIRSRYAGYGEQQPRCLYFPGPNPIVRIEFTKGVDWLAITGATLAVSALATVGVLAYAVYKISQDMPWIPMTIAIGAGLFFLTRALNKELKLGGYAAEAARRRLA